MPGTIPRSSVLEFYNDAKIFITGGTGFLGKALLEKFLRVCNVKHIYILIRMKKGKDPQTRLKELFNDPLFQVLRKEKPDFEKKITCIPGELGFEKLNMSDNDYEFLVNEVTHVLHSGATVRFNEKLRTAIDINVLGTNEMVEFCKKCIHLKIFVYVSTAYSHCERGKIEEEYYEPPMSGDKTLELVKTLSEDKINSIAEELIKPWPNTYTFTKAIAEDIVKEKAKSMPAVVFRPGIIMGTYKEPVEGWIDNIYGPTGIVTAVGVGLMRIHLADEDLMANIVPVDRTINALLSSAWEVGNNFNNNSVIENSLTESTESTELAKTGLTAPKIYNFVVDERNAINWGQFRRINLELGELAPSIKTIWYYTMSLTKFRTMYMIIALFFHFIPAAIADGICILLGKKPRLWNAYIKMYQFAMIMSTFSTTHLIFTDHNLKSLYSSLSEADKELFEFDMTTIDWRLYLSRVLWGIRRYILNESDSTLPRAKRKQFYLWIVHRAVQFCLLIFSLWILSKFLFTFDDLKVRLKEPVLMHSGLLRNST